MPHALRDYRGAHAGAAIVVCGCGGSLNLLREPSRFITVGVNDVGALFTPDYLVVVNPRSEFAEGRFVHIAESKSKAVFTHLAELDIPHPNVVTFRLGEYGGVDIHDGEVLHFTQNSPYVATCLAIYMGAARIGLIGVDFTEGHFYGPTGVHNRAHLLREIDREYAAITAACRLRGIDIRNLSPMSRLTSIASGSLEEFAVPVAGG